MDFLLIPLVWRQRRASLGALRGFGAEDAESRS
jgi:hypothetical protein